MKLSDINIFWVNKNKSYFNLKRDLQTTRRNTDTRQWRGEGDVKVIPRLHDEAGSTSQLVEPASSCKRGISVNDNKTSRVKPSRILVK